jgi:haloalkane dehalogenase
MNNNASNTNRRQFLTATGLAASAGSIASLAFAAELSGAEKKESSIVNALLPTPLQFAAFAALPDDSPIVMVNLLKFKPNGGREEYAKYAAGVQPILEKIGAKVLFTGSAQFCLIGQADWDMIALVQYPRKKTLVQMASSQEYRAIHHHREAGLQGQINYAVVQTEAVTKPIAATHAADEIRPGVFRTPDDRFANLPGFDFKPNYHKILGYRVHYLDEGPSDAAPILLLHGEPTWSFLYRKMIPVLTAAGYRCIVPDLIGFGRSDKPADQAIHTYQFHVDAVAELVRILDLKNCTFFGQDWGGLIGLRVVTENEARFARIVISNTGLPTGEGPISPAFLAWKLMNKAMIQNGDMPVGDIIANHSKIPSLKQPYDAPYPDKRFKAGPLIFPQLVPVTPDDPATAANKRAWDALRQWKKPFLTAFGDSDPITGGSETKFQKEVPGANGQPHQVIQGATHFIQETHGEILARVIVDFITQNPSAK